MNALQKALALAGLLFLTPSCTTDAYCFDDCKGARGGMGGGDSGASSGTGGDVIINTRDSGACTGTDCLGGGGDAKAPPPPCTQTNGGREICDGLDNDCDGKIDEPGVAPDGIDFTNPRTCGTCDLDCTDPVNNLKHVLKPTCSAGAADGKTPGTCDYEGCAPGTYDVDSNRSNGCEYACPDNPNGTNTADLGYPFGCTKDDDCNGIVDDGLDYCRDPENCGFCGNNCNLPNTVTTTCVSSAGSGACDANNTHCEVGQCAAGFYDIDGDPTTGCEYPCAASGVEVCDGKDNDCDGKVDNEDPDLETGGTVGVDCAGGDKGLCAVNRGFIKCIDGVLQCCDQGSNNTPTANPDRYPPTGLRNDQCDGATAPHVTVPGQIQETCNDTSAGTDPRFDDDCDGVIDGVTIDDGKQCGSGLGACLVGHTVCAGGVEVCSGATGAKTAPNPANAAQQINVDPCNAVDDDCDGVIDGTVTETTIKCSTDADCTGKTDTATGRAITLCVQLSAKQGDRGCVAPPPDIYDVASGVSVACNVPPPPPSGVTQPCKAGKMACFGGTPQCVGSITKPQDTDRCGDDTNCNGTLDNQGNLGPNDDVKNCGACGNDCTALGANMGWQCQAGKCVASGCQPGFIDCDGNKNDCERACTFQQSAELCDGVDNDCNCQVDEGTITPPSPIQACGVSPAATDPGCAAKVALACVAGGWKCTFTDPAYCTTGNCQTTPDVCDGKDNNCDGVVDEGFHPPALLTGFLGQGCFSDDGKPAPGDGPCRTQGVFVCNGAGTATQCSAVKDASKISTELCDGVDNDCNGTVDDPAAVSANDSRLGKQCFGGTQGVCALPANAGAVTCVTGAPLCTGANVVRPGDKLETCNGKDDDCSGTVDDNLVDTGGACGSGVGECKAGTQQCVAGGLKCNDVGSTPEVCDGKDNNCNGQIDDSPTDVGTGCNVPPAPPAGVPQPCKGGVFACIGSAKVCQGSVTPQSASDACGEDTNCDGKLTNQTGLSNADVFNCGACGNNCNTKDPTGNSIWACQAGVCVHSGCKSGFVDCDANANTCERACTVTSATETCDGVDNNCNCQIDDNLPAVTPVQVCGVGSLATAAGCTTGVTTACVAGAWKCTFPAGYCTGASCSATVDVCDGRDNNCNGPTDEAFSAPNLAVGFLGQPCNSDTGKASTDGPCQTSGSFVCNGAGTATQCSAVKDVSKIKPELCDGVDNDCNGTIDDPAAVSTNDVRIGKQCFGGTLGVCALPANAGTVTCVTGAPLCTGANVVRPGDKLETCNGKDDDCSGTVDDNLVDTGGACGSGVGECKAGTQQCVAGGLKCNDVGPTSEVCDGKDNNCNGQIDDSPTDVGTGCNVPPAPPAGVPQPCKGGVFACIGSAKVCQGSVTPQSASDACGEDTNCDGKLTNQTGLSNADVFNCGACGNNCNTKDPTGNSIWACQAGVCVHSGCKSGFVDCDANANTCERACTVTSATETCDGVDNNCNCQIDDNLPAVTPVQVCGVGSLATAAGCTTGVTTACVAGAWKCTFPAGYCTGASCSATVDVCDGRDNNCNGPTDEAFSAPNLAVGFLGQPCNSDTGKASTDGPCQTSGSFVCNGAGTATQCSAVKDVSKIKPELCDGVDNDCNGTIDDPAAVSTNDVRIGKQCFGGTLGVCALPANAGAVTCVTGAPLCTGANVVRPGDKLETCNGKDDDCSGTVDDNLVDTGGACGSGVGECKAGTQQCVAGGLKCNDVGPTSEICDGKDNNCNGQIDDSPTDVGTGCNVPPAPPAGVPQPCKGGVFACIGSAKVCQGSVTPQSASDACGEDTNCDGKLTNQTGLSNADVFNCGACGNNCNTVDPNGVWSCQSGACVRTGCKSGFIDCDGNVNTCERACTITSATELCNGKDDNCNCQIDDAVQPVTPIQACGVSSAATDLGCTTGVTTTCTAGAWKCTFPAGYCTGTSCSVTNDTCDGKDNDCDGNTDDTFKAPILASGFLGQICTSDSGKPAPGDGPCQTTGAFVCNGAGTATVCSAAKDPSKATVELCDGIDNDCNGIVDDAAAVTANDSRVNKQCFAGTQGECITPAHAGSTACQSGAIVCTGANLLKPNTLPETCNGKDDDCDGTLDDSPTDVGQSCGSGTGACVPGIMACVAGAPKCQGSVAGTPEKCNGVDDDCNGVIDNNLTDTGSDCNVPPAAPAPTAQCATVTEPCKKGTLSCSGGVLQCQGSITASALTPDGCCTDSNCDGVLTNQPDLLTDVHNCGGCGNDCDAVNAGKHGVWACQTGACVRTGCAIGYINCDGTAGDCERACTFGGAELCNGVDDDCNCAVDDAVASVPLPSQVCGVTASASDPKCQAGDGTTGIKVACSTGAWKCTFPTGYCDKGAPATCSTTPDTCDGKDNNCNGNTDESYKLPVLQTGYVGQACASDDGKPPPGDGQCRGTGAYACNGAGTGTVCGATRNNALAGAENCDGVDNDCDGLVDEPFSNKGTNATYFVKPAVVSIGASLWMYQYEASRPSATPTSPGSGNGYYCTGAGCTGGVPAAPAGVTLDKTSACSVSGKIPWFNVTPAEVEETCQARGGFVCTTPTWTTACQAGSSCKWGYASGCTANANYAAGPFCNLGAYDFDGVAGAPNTDGLLPTASDNPPLGGPLKSCYANLGAGLFDLTGNLREITKRGANDYPLMGGAFNTAAEDGAQCSFAFYSVTTSFSFYDAGFRCCFSADPTL